MNKTTKFIVSVAVPVAVGALSGLFTVTGEGSWYRTINKPSWNPPGWIFGPVWTTLYILMGIAFYQVWRLPESKAGRTAILLFGIQLILNFFWSFIFFNQHQIGWALVEIIAMWIMILLTIFVFAKVNTVAAWLLVPYISWVSFAAILNYTIWRLN